VTVRLKMATDEAEAEIVCGLLRSEGIRCFHRETDFTAHAAIPGPGGWREILVNEEDLPRARELLDAAVEPVDECVRCGREIGEDGGWYPDEARELHPYCGVCAERLFGEYGLAG
jgi:Putative prokaryotic signal transducing protein